MATLSNSWRRVAAAAVGLAFFASCSEDGEVERSAVRLSPLQLEAASGTSAGAAWALFDRDTRTGWTPGAGRGASVFLRVQLDRPSALTHLKVFGPSPYALAVRTGDGAAVNGLTQVRLDGLAPGWSAFPVNVPVLSSDLVLEFTRIGAEDGPLSEIELWSADRPAAPLDARRLQTLSGEPPAGLEAVGAQVGPIALTPAERCAPLSFQLSRSPASYRRAWIVYGADGAFRSFVLTRALNGGPARRGIWFDALAPDGTFVDPIDPESLLSGDNAYQLCLPDGATSSVVVHNARFIGELDQGSNGIERIARGPLDGVATEDASGLLDPTNTAPALVHAGERLVVAFDRWSSPDAVVLRRATGTWAVDCLDQRGQAKALLPASVTADMLRTVIAFAPGGELRECAALALRPADGKDAFLTSVTVVASGTRGRVDWPKIVLGSPQEHFGLVAWLDGWATAPGALGAATSVDLQLEDSSASRGVFAKLLQRSSDRERPWPVMVTAHFADGSEISRTFVLEKGGASLAPPGDGLSEEERAARYGRPGDARTVTVDPKAEVTSIRLGTEVGVDVPRGAVSSKLDITLKHLAATEMPPLDPGMVNVTAPSAHAYEYLPHHQQFKQPVDIILPYDPSLLPPGYTAEDIHSYYFDTEVQRWQPLARAKLDTQRRAVHSLSDHFTAMIDAVVVAPEHPELQQLDPNALSGIKAANPGAGIRLIEAPSASSRGDASLSYPFDLPAGRRGLTPPLALSYSSGRGNGWVGVGWDLPVGAISVDTRFGAARYDAQLESETYLLDGEQLTPVAHRGPEKRRTDDTVTIRGETVKVFHARVEGPFHQIIRHGQGPGTYWWEVVDKAGTRSFYGGTPERHGAADGATLRSQAGAVFQWALVEIRDLHQNAVRYEYDRVSSAGFATGTVPGTTLYPKAIRYTFAGAAATAPYDVTFAREGRPDTIIDGRGGFKHVVAERLRRVEVHFQGQLVRAWELTYVEGAFHKSLLQRIRQLDASGATFPGNEHAFEYFDEVREPVAGGGYDYRGFASPESWAAGDDHVSAIDVPGPAQGLLGNGEASVLGGSYGDRAGGHVYIGFNPLEPTKQNSFGGKIGFNATFGNNRLALMDVDGDGLPDKVFLGGGGVVYRRNASGPGGAPGFLATAQPLPDLPSLGAHHAMTLAFGLEAYPTIFSVLFNASGTFSTEDTYFADVNGDGLPDLVQPGTVLFNTPTPSGPRFTADDSSGTPLPIVAGTVSPAGLVPDYSADDAQNAQRFPLIDSIRRWVAPYAGTVQISGPVQLHPGSPSGDGIRAAIQLNGSELWSVAIAPGDAAPKNPTNVSAVTVRAGDRIYFRVSALSDTRDHVVDWNPTVLYTGRSALVDANGRDERRFRASTDFALGGRDGLFITAPFDGTLKLEGTVTKATTTDDVTLEVLKNGQRVWSDSRQATSAQPFTADLSLAVKANDRLEVAFRSDSPVDLSALGWSPSTALRWVYASATDSNGHPITVIQNGQPLFDMPAPFDMDTYGVRVPGVEQPVYVASANGTLRVDAKVSGPTGAQAIFTVKKLGSRLAKRAFSQPGTSEVALVVRRGDRLYFDFSTRQQAVVQASVTVSYDGRTWSAAPSLLHMQGLHDLCSRPYRGWSYAGLNGNKVPPSTVIPESQLCVSTSSFGSGASVPGDVEGAKQQGQQVNDDTWTFAMVPFPTGRKCQSTTQACDLPQVPLWGGADDQLYVLPGSMSASRHGANDISSPKGAAVAHGPTVARLSRTWQLAESAGAGAGGISGSISNSNGLTQGVVDYLDMNGDGFPDVVGSGGIQYTSARGTLGAGAACSGSPCNPRESTTGAQSIGIGGTVAQQIGNTRGRATATGTSPGGEAGNRSQMLSLGISLSANGGHGDSSSDLLDVNGDGLPDRVLHEAGKLFVQLNVGYGFLPAEPFDDGAVNLGSSVEGSVGADLGFNDGIYGFGGGLTAERGETRIRKYIDLLQPDGETLADLNGDGLPDRVVPSGDGYQVQLNTGSRFGPPVAWKGGQTGIDVTQSADLSVGGGLYFTIGIGPLCVGGCWLIINPGVEYSASMNRQEIAVRDIDGDGYPDQLFSMGSDQLVVSHSLIGRTNLLKKVTRPMQATVALDYTRAGNTFDQPHSQWVLSKVVAFDGVAGDWRASNPGADYQLATFTYEGGRYDRLERDFYGYARVVTTMHDTRGLRDGVPEGFSKPYLRTTQVFRNDSFFTKGLLVSQTVEGVDTGAPRTYSQTENAYALREVDTGRVLSTPQALAGTLSPVFPELRSIVRRRAEGDPSQAVETRTEQAYDADGNVVQVVDSGDVGTADDFIATITYAGHSGANDACADQHIVGVADSITVTDVAGNLLRHRESRLDCANGDLVELRQATGTGGDAVSNFLYTAEGNLAAVTGPSNLHGQRYALHFSYDVPTRSHVTAVTDSFGYNSSSEYDLRFGAVTRTTDANGQDVTSSYDAAGRLVSVVGPYQAGTQLKTLTFEYHPEAVVPYARTAHVDTYRDSGDPIEMVLFADGLGRVLQTKQDATVFQGKAAAAADVMTVSGCVAFDHAGRTFESYYPTVEAKGVANATFNQTCDGKAPPTRTDFDVLGRALATTFPDGTIARVAYELAADRHGARRFATTATDALGAKSVTYRDIRDRILAVQQFNAPKGEVIWTEYAYDAVDQLKAVQDDHGNLTAVGYDAAGRTLSIDNPDTGRTEMAYDAASNLVRKVTATLRAQSKAITYDYEYNRLKAIHYPTFPQDDVSYSYGGATMRGQPGNLVGRLMQVADASGSETRSYGKLGELVQETKTVASHTLGTSDQSPEVWTTRYVYDTWGRVQQMTYPDGEVLTYSYDSGGLVRAASGTKLGVTTPYLQRLEYDEFGQRVYMKVGNGVESTYAYDPRNRRLSRLAAGDFQDLHYGYDPVGNITSLSNQVPVPSPNEYGGPVDQTFQYDGLYRLTGATGEWRYGHNKRDSYSLSMAFDTIHNITRKTQTHDVTTPGGATVPQRKTTYDALYTYAGLQPHAATQVGERTYAYDRNGNQSGWESLTSGQRRTIDWDDENRVRAIHDNGRTTAFVYDDGGERVIKRGAQGETAYVNQFWTVRNRTVGTKHIYAGETRIASKVVPGTANVDPGTGDPFGGVLGQWWQHRSEQGWQHGQNTVKNPHYAGNEMPDILPEDNFVYFYHPDHLGSASYATSPTGDLYEHLEYFPFGETWVSEQSNTERLPYLYTGKELDQETGLYYFGARYYDPRTSVWQSPDPILRKYLGGQSNHGVFTPANLALYSYTWNHPLGLVDRFGLDPGDPWYVRAGMGALGVAYGTAQALAPGGFLLDAAGPPTTDRDFLVGKAAGNMATGVVQVIGGATAAAGGTAVTIGTGGVGAIVGAPAAAVGVAEVVQGCSNIVASAHTISMMVSGSGSGGGGGSGGQRNSPEREALVDMAKQDKKTGITPEDMEAYKKLNSELPDPFPEEQVRGPETHPLRTPQSQPGPGQQPHGHVGPVDHIPIKAETP